MANLKGYNGFNDITTYDFANTGKSTSTGGLQKWTVVKNVSEGVPINIRSWVIANSNLANHIISSDESTWLKAYEGVYLSEFKSADTEEGLTYSLEFSFGDVTLQQILGADNVQTITDEPPNILACNCRPYADESNQLCNYLGLAHVDFLSNPMISNREEALAHYSFGRNAIFFFGRRGGGADSADLYCDIMYNSSILHYDYVKMEDFVGGGEYLLTNTTRGAIGWEGLDIFKPDDPEDDPSGPGGGGPGGAYGTEPSDSVPWEGVPNNSPVNSGFVHLYNPTETQLIDLRNYVYTAASVLEQLKLTNNILDYIINLAMFPAVPNVSGVGEISVANAHSNVLANIISNSFQILDCGTVNISESYQSFCDYSPLTKTSLFLPFIGTVQLDTDLVMNSTVELNYGIDYFTGNCIATVMIRNKHGLNRTLTYQFSGSCSMSIPMSGIDYSTKYQAQANQLATIGMGVAGTILSGGVGAMGAAGSFVNSALSVQAAKPQAIRSGSISGTPGLMGGFTPYIMVERPAQSFPAGNNKQHGRPANIGGVLSSFSGYTEVSEIITHNIKATDSELDEIKELLSNGVYV